MSPASRNCGTVCSARGRWSNAPDVPRVSGNPGAHYDLRAARQLGSQKVWPKCDSEVKIAAFVSRGSALNPTLSFLRALSFLRGDRLRHSPPFPCLPTAASCHMRDRYARVKPLGMPRQQVLPEAGCWKGLPENPLRNPLGLAEFHDHTLQRPGPVQQCSWKAHRVRAVDS
jgi:hypothetical protein